MQSTPVGEFDPTVAGAGGEMEEVQSRSMGNVGAEQRTGHRGTLSAERKRERDWALGGGVCGMFGAITCNLPLLFE